MYDELRSIPLTYLMQHFELQFKRRKGKAEYFGSCGVHGGTTSFSFDEKRFHCFGCGVKGAGAIDFMTKVKKLGFKDAIAFLESLGYENETENKVFNGNYEKYYQPSALDTRYPKEVINAYGVGLYSNPARQSLYSEHFMFPIRRYSDGAKVGYLASPNEDGEVIWPSIAKHLEVYGSYELKQLVESQGQARLPLGYLVDSPWKVLDYRSTGLYAVYVSSPLSASQVRIVSTLFEAVRVRTLKDAEVLAPLCFVRVASH